METQQIEYKQQWNDSFLKEICAFANANGGILYIGITDEGDICGVGNAKYLLENLPNQCAMTMGIIPEINLLEQDGKQYLSVSVQKSNIPIALRGKYYIRSGTSVKELTGIALQDFIMRAMNRSWDDMTVEDTSLDDIDPAAVRYFVRRGIACGRVSASAETQDVQQILQQLNLIAKDGQMKAAAILLFGKNPQRHFISSVFRIGRFGYDETDLIANDIIGGNLIQMTDKVIIALDKYLIRPIHYEGMQRIEPLEIPEKALREIINNAIVHKDYRGADIQMKVYADHIRLWNEGRLPDDIPAEKVYQEHSSHPRNKLIASTFYLAGFIESWGRGFQTIRSEFLKEHLQPPTFESAEGGLITTILRERFVKISNGEIQEQENKSQYSIIDTLTERQRKIVQALMNGTISGTIKDGNGTINGTTNAVSLSAQLDIPLRTLKRDLQSLNKLGIIRHVGANKDGYWELVSQ